MAMEDDKKIPAEEIPSDVSPLMIAVLQGHIGTVRMMISQGYDVLQKTKTGETAMTFAERLRNETLIEMLNAAMNKQKEKASKPANYDPTLFASCRRVGVDKKIAAPMRTVVYQTRRVK